MERRDDRDRNYISTPIGEQNENFIACIDFYRSLDNSEDKFGSQDSKYDGKFGFDRFNKKVCAEGLASRYEKLSSVIPKKETYTDKKEYLCAYLAIWPPNVEGNKDNKKSKVSLYVKANEANIKGTSKEGDIEFFSSDEKIKIKQSNVKLSLSGPAQVIDIECSGSFTDDVSIIAKAKGEPQELGRLIIKANNIIYKTIIQPVDIVYSTSASNDAKDIANSDFFIQLVAYFNEHSFNQAYMYGELATTTKQVTFAQKEFIDKKFISLMDDGKFYLEKKSEKDRNTVNYNNLVEERYASMISNFQKKQKAKEKVKEKTQIFLKEFKKYFEYKDDSKLKKIVEYHRDKIGKIAWENSTVQILYKDYKTAYELYINEEGGSTRLNKTNKLHVFYTKDIHAARNPESKVYAYSSLYSGVVHIFESSLIHKEANAIIIHELGHSLSLAHSFDQEDLGNYEIKKEGEKYKDDIESQIEEQNTKKKELNRRLDISKNEKIEIENVIILEDLKTKYSELYNTYANNISRVNLSGFDEIINAIMEYEKQTLKTDNISIESVSNVQNEIKEIDKKIDGLKLELKSAKKPQTLSNAKEQSNTLENFMDYDQDKNGKTKENFQRKIFYQWQWKDMQKTGKDAKYFVPKEY